MSWGGVPRSLRSPVVHMALFSPPFTYTSWFSPDHSDARQVAEGRDLSHDHQGVAVDVDGWQLLASKSERLAGAPGHADYVGALPGAGIEDDAAAPGLRCRAQAQQSGVQDLMGGCRPALDKAPFVGPLGDGLSRVGFGDADVGAPGVLPEEQEIAPHRATLFGLVLHAEATVPEGHDLGGTGGELRRPERRQLRRGRGSAVLPVESGVAAAHGDSRSVATLQLAEEVLRATRHDAGERVAAVVVLEVGDELLFHRGVVLPVGAVEQHDVVGPIRRQEYGSPEQPLREAASHLFGARIEPEPRRVAIVVAAPVEHATAIGSLPVINLGVRRPLARLRLREQRHGAFGIGTAGEVLHPARGEHHRERRGLPGDVGDLRGRVGQTALARQPARGPHQAREGFVIEDPRQHVREQRLEADAAVLQRAHQGRSGFGWPILEIREDLQRALGGEAVVRVGGEPGERGVEILAMDFERVLLEIGVADVRVDRREPVQRPALGWREANALARGAVATDLDIDLELRRLRQGDPDFAR